MYEQDFAREKSKLIKNLLNIKNNYGTKCKSQMFYIGVNNRSWSAIKFNQGTDAGIDEINCIRNKTFIYFYN